MNRTNQVAAAPKKKPIIVSVDSRQCLPEAEIESILEAMEAQRKIVTSSREAALAFLNRAGIDVEKLPDACG